MTQRKLDIAYVTGNPHYTKEHIRELSEFGGHSVSTLTDYVSARDFLNANSVDAIVLEPSDFPAGPGHAPELDCVVAGSHPEAYGKFLLEKVIRADDSRQKDTYVLVHKLENEEGDYSSTAYREAGADQVTVMCRPGEMHSIINQKFGIEETRIRHS